MTRLSLTEYSALLCKTVQAYSFPAVTFDFVNNRECRHRDMRGIDDMRGVEKHVHELLCSADPGDVRDGLSNVLYWGWAQARGLQRVRVAAFRGGLPAADDRLTGFTELVRSMPQSAAERLLALKDLALPQFTQMSFTTKILMFLDPNGYPVLDLKLARAYGQQDGFPPLQDLTVRTSIPITASNGTCYEQWAYWCRSIAARVNGASGSPCRGLRAVDVERALFVLADSGQMDQAQLLLDGPSCE